METLSIAEQERNKNEAAQAAERLAMHEKAQENLRKIEQRAQEMHKESLQKHTDQQRQDMQKREQDRQQTMRNEIMQRERDRAADLRDRDRQKTEARKAEDRQQEDRAAARAHAMDETRKAIIAQRAQMQENAQTQATGDGRMMAGSAKGPTMRPDTLNGRIAQAVEMDHPGLTDAQKSLVRDQMGIQPGEGWQNREADRKAAVREQAEINKQMQRERAREQMIRKAAEVHAHPTTADQARQADNRQRFAEDKQAQAEQDMWHKDHSQTPRERDDGKDAHGKDADLLEQDDLSKEIGEK